MHAQIKWKNTTRPTGFAECTSYLFIMSGNTSGTTDCGGFTGECQLRLTQQRSIPWLPPDKRPSLCAFVLIMWDGAEGSTHDTSTAPSPLHFNPFLTQSSTHTPLTETPRRKHYGHGPRLVLSLPYLRVDFVLATTRRHSAPPSTMRISQMGKDTVWAPK